MSLLNAPAFLITDYEVLLSIKIAYKAGRALFPFYRCSSLTIFLVYFLYIFGVIIFFIYAGLKILNKTTEHRNKFLWAVFVVALSKVLAKIKRRDHRIFIQIYIGSSEKSIAVADS